MTKRMGQGRENGCSVCMGGGDGANHGEEGYVAANLYAAHVDLDDGAPPVGVVQRDVLVRRGRHEGPLDPPLPERVAVGHPELGGQQHGAQPTIDLAARGVGGLK
jgi:hypothetical protein